MIQKALKLCEFWHQGQVRKFSGEPFCNHPKRVHILLSKFTDNVDILCASLLHDVIEDCGVQPKEIEYEFNLVVASIVEEVTNVYTKETWPDLTRAERKEGECERLSKISYSGKLIKLADRIDNILDFKTYCEDFGPDFYYVKETRKLLKALKGTHKQLERILGDFVYI